MKELANQIWCGIALVGLFLAYAAYCVWCWITGQPVQPIN